MKKITSVLLFLCSCFLIFYSSILFYVGRRVYLDDKKQMDAILVLGAKSYKGITYNPCLKSRVEHAVDLYNQGFAKKIIMSGGNDLEDKKNEAETMKKIAQELKVPAKDIIIENESSSSYENILFSKKIMQNQDIKSVIIVTEPFHSPRASLIAKKINLNFSISPTLTSQCWLRWKFGSRYFLREPLAIIQYFLQGKI